MISEAAIHGYLLAGFSAIGAIFMYYIRRNDTRHDNAEIEMKEIKANYLDRFEKVNENVTDNALKTQTQIGDLKTDIEKKHGELKTLIASITNNKE